MFEKNNTYGKGRVKGSRNKKTIAKESLNRLSEVGIFPLEVSKEIISSLVENTELKATDKLNLLSTMVGLFRYELLERKDEIKLFELQEENEELTKENQELKENFIGSPRDLINSLENKIKEENKND